MIIKIILVLSFGGGEDIDKKFVGQIYRKIKSGDKKIYAINDVFGTPAYTVDVAKILKQVISESSGIYHFSSGAASRYEIAVELVKNLGVDVDVVPISYEEYHKKFPLKVPYTKCEVLQNNFVENSRDWKEAIKEYVNENFISPK